MCDKSGLVNKIMKSVGKQVHHVCQQNITERERERERERGVRTAVSDLTVEFAITESDLDQPNRMGLP